MMTEPSHIYPKLSGKYGLSEETIRNIIIYFWRSGVKRSLESMINKEIYINKLGSFEIKDWKLKYVIPMSYLLSQRIDVHERNTEYFTLLNEQLIKIEKDIKEVELKNQEFNELKKNSRDIQEPQEDMGRPEE